MRSGSSQRGFTYIALMILVAALGTGLAAYGELASHAAQREKEAQLAWIGEQFRQAIGLYYQRTPGAAKRYPQTLRDLLEDKRFLTPQRYLRRIYRDPLTGSTEWGLVEAPGGGIAGVYSVSGASSVGRATAGGISTTPGGVPYHEWKFVYTPPVGPVK
jgi:type II secretory pathway pseudopilin PulG